MGTKDGWINAGETLQFIASYENLDGSLATGKSPTISITNNLTGANLITGAAMTPATNLPVYFYNYVAVSAGIYTNIVTWDDGEQSSAAVQVGAGTVAVLSDLDNLDASVSSRLASADYTAPDNANIANILADTNELQSNQSNWETADLTDIALEASAQAIKAKTDNLPADPAASSEIDALNNFNPATEEVTTDSASRAASKADLTGIALSSEITSLNNLSAQNVWEYVARTLTSSGSGGATAQEVWEYATRTLTDAAAITEDQFHEYLTSYPASLPDGVQPGVILPPDNTDLVNVQVNCFYNDDTAVTTITPIIKIIGSNFYDDKIFTFDSNKWTYLGGVLQFSVPAYCKISIAIAEVNNFQNSGYVGAGGTVINGKNLYATDQTPAA